MKKIMLLSLFFLLLAMPVKATGKDGNSYINGIDADYPPFSYLDEKGQPTGFDVDALNWIAKTMGFQVTHKIVDWDEIIPALLAKKIDLIDSGMSITDNRKQVITFSDPYWFSANVFLVAKDSNLTSRDIFNKRIAIGVQKGDVNIDNLKKDQEQKSALFELKYYDSALSAANDVIAKKIEVALMDHLVASELIAKAKPVKILDVYDNDSVGVAIRKEDTKLLSLINEGYKKLKNSSYWDELQAKYLWQLQVLPQ